MEGSSVHNVLEKFNSSKHADVPRLWYLLASNSHASLVMSFAAASHLSHLTANRTVLETLTHAQHLMAAAFPF